MKLSEAPYYLPLILLPQNLHGTPFRSDDVLWRVERPGNKIVCITSTGSALLFERNYRTVEVELAKSFKIEVT